jgi:hypothetical protein
MQKIALAIMFVIFGATTPVNAIACKGWCGKYNDTPTCYSDCAERGQPEVPDRDRPEARSQRISCEAWCSKCKDGASTCTSHCSLGKMVNASCSRTGN